MGARVCAPLPGKRCPVESYELLLDNPPHDVRQVHAAITP